MKSAFILSVVILAVGIVSCKQDKLKQLTFDGSIGVIPFEELGEIKCRRLSEDIGLVIYQNMINSMVSDGGYSLSIVNREGHHVLSFSLFGYVDHSDHKNGNLRCFVGKVGERSMVLPTVQAKDFKALYYHDASGFHEISISSGPNENSGNQ